MALMRAAGVDEMRKPGKMLNIRDGSKSYVLINAGGELFCIDGTCMKNGCKLADGKLDGYVLTCAWHGGQFDVRTGYVMKNVPPEYGIATNLIAHRVLVQSNEIFIEV
jgi:nitrite reductase/ring-hydroxylating ferredoxin subunit